MDAWIYHGWTDRLGTMNTGPSAWNIICKEKSGDVRTEVPCIYGIRVNSTGEWRAVKLRGGDSAGPVSFRPPGGRLIEKLRRLSVTPTGLLEAVDDEVGRGV